MEKTEKFENSCHLSPAECQEISGGGLIEWFLDFVVDNWTDLKKGFSDGVQDARQFK